MSDVEAEKVSRRATREGRLLVTRWLRPHDRGRLSVVGMMLDIAQPRYDLSVALVCGKQIGPNLHEQVFGIRGKGAEGVTKDDDGRPARVRGTLTQWQGNDRYGDFTRASVEFLDATGVCRD